jgi:hypothetical protein
MRLYGDTEIRAPQRGGALEVLTRVAVLSVTVAVD